MPADCSVRRTPTIFLRSASAGAKQLPQAQVYHPGIRIS